MTMVSAAVLDRSPPRCGAAFSLAVGRRRFFAFIHERGAMREIPADRLAVNAARKAAIEALTPEERAARAERKAAACERHKRQKTARNERQRHGLEQLLTGYSSVEAARALGCHERTMSEAVGAIWPLPYPGPSNRYVAVRVSVAELAAIDGVAGELQITRLRAAEEIMSAALLQAPHVIRRTLRLARMPP